MTTLNNIMNHFSPAVQKTAQGNGLSPQGPTLSDFLGMILSPTDAAAAQQNLPLSETDMQALTEKIAAIMNGKGVDNSPLQGSGLMQTLSAPMATDIQNAEALPPITDADMAEMAQMLNDIEPGAADTDAQIAALIAQAPSNAQTPEDMAAVIAQKIAAALQQQNKDATASAKAAATSSATGAPALATLQNILQLQADPAAQPQANTPPQAPQHHTAQPTAADDAPLPAPQAQQPSTDGKPLPQTPAVTGQNGNMQNGFGQNGFSQGGFGQNNFNQNGFTFFAQADGGMTGTDTAVLQNASQSFAQYNAQATAQALPAQTTQMIAFQMQRNAAAKVDSFTLQLDPADLGRLDVELKFHRDGSVQAHLSADRPETLAMLQKDSAHLERILQQAGFDTKDGALSFDLRQQSDNNDAGGTGNKRANADGINNGTTNDNIEAAQNAAEQTRLSGHVGLQGVNIMV